MKKYLGLFLLLIVVGIITENVFAAAATSPVSGNYSGAPENVVAYRLGSTTTTDSLYTSTGRVVYGPFNLCVTPRSSSAKGFRAYMPLGGLASGDSVQLAYQILPSGQLSDTSATWTAVDTLITGKKGTYTDISSLPGISIVFRLLNIDASKVGLIAGKKTIVVLTVPSNEIGKN